MTDNTQPEALRLANVCSNLTRYSMEAHLIAAELRRQHARIAELEAQLEAIGAGGVSGPLMGRASLSTNAAAITSETGNSAAAQGAAITSESLSANAGEPTPPDEWKVRGYLAKTLKCWHRLTGEEAAELVAMTLRLSGLYAAPPTAQAEGWISVDERLPDEAQAYGRESDDCLVELPNKRFTCAMVVRTTSGPKWLDQDSRVVYPVRWMRIPPTSAEGVEHGSTPPTNQASEAKGA